MVSVHPETLQPSKYPLWTFKSARLRIAFLLMFCWFCAMALRVNLSMAVVCMVNSTAYENANPAKSEYANLTLNEGSKCGVEYGEKSDGGYRVREIKTLL